MAHAIKELLVTENKDDLGGMVWLWSTLLDSRTCERCAPLDQQRWRERENKPYWPLHIGCRCQLLLIDPDDEFWNSPQREGTQIRDEEAGAYATGAKTAERYATRNTLNAQSCQGARRSPQRYSDVLARWADTSMTSLEEALGKGRAAWFKREYQRTKADPQKILQKMLTAAPAGDQTWIPLKNLPVNTPTKPKPGRRLPIGNPDRASSGELYNVSLPMKIDGRTPNTGFQEGVPVLKQALVDSRQAVTDLLTKADLKTLDAASGVFLKQLGEVESAVKSVSRGLVQFKAKALESRMAARKALDKMSPALNKVYQEALKTPLTKAQIKEFVDGVEIVGGTAAERKLARGYVDEFVQLFNGAGITKDRSIRIDRIVLGKGDPKDLSQYHFTPKLNQVEVPSGFSEAMHGKGKMALMHEMGHAVEASQPMMVSRQEAWIKSRSTAKAPGFVQAGYGPDDVMDGVYPDKFVNTYVGAVYEDNNIPGEGLEQMMEVMEDSQRAAEGLPRKWKYTPAATETISVGVEYFVDPRARAELFTRDPDHFNLILSLTRQVLGE